MKKLFAWMRRSLIVDGCANAEREAAARNKKFEKIIERKQDERFRCVAPLYEEVWETRRFGKLHSRHTFWLEFAAGALGIITIAVIVAIADGRASDDPKTSWLSCAIAPAALVATWQFLHTTITKRRGAAAMMTSEIMAIARIFAAANIVGEFVEQYARLEKTGAMTPNGFGDVARKENYFSIFDKTVENLSSLQLKALYDVTSFYTFMKAARDATGAISLWKEGYPVEQCKEDVVSIVYLCFLQLMHGHFAVEGLIEKNETKHLLWAEEIFTGTELQCFLFLFLVLKEGDFRRDAINLRGARYEALAKMHGFKKMFAAVVGEC
jgi:hypothetical protein